MNTLLVPQGLFELQRLPARKRELLRAFDTADQYLLETLDEQQLPQAEQRVLIVNDSFGVLAVALSAYKPLTSSDSFLSQQATRNNLALNHIPADAATFLTSLESPGIPLDLVVIKVPKNLGLLEYQLLSLRPWINPNTKILVAGMLKNMPSSVWQLLESLIGPTETFEGKKKSKLIEVHFDPDLTPPEKNPYPVFYPLENTRFTLCNHANVFSRDNLDIGTRFLLEYLPDNPEYRDYIDLGCGNGIVGLLIAENNPEARLTFVDESYMAVASAQENFEAGFQGEREAQFVVGDGLTEFPKQTADCILCNPPFHQHHAISNQIAWEMFKQSRRVLRHGGELRIIGNRHLHYHLTLKKLFGAYEIVAANAKFVVIKCVKK